MEKGERPADLPVQTPGLILKADSAAWTKKLKKRNLFDLFREAQLSG
jgi:hypothetical protein